MPTRELRAKRLGISVKMLPDGRGRHSNHCRGSSHYKWNEQIVSKDGYKLVRVGKAHPLADPNGYAREHILIADSVYGVNAVTGNAVHHINGDKLDNRVENLQILTLAEHNHIHNAEKAREEETGRFVGKRRAGRLLDGVEHNVFPKESPCPKN